MLFVLALVALGAASAQGARLTVVPRGEQVFDIVTGETELPDGGTIVDRETGVELDADWIRYREGAFVEAEDAVAEGAFGRFHAEELHVDLAATELVATGGVTLEREGLEMTAVSLRFLAEKELVRLERAIGATPQFEAEAVLIDVRSGDALLLGPYRYAGGAFELEDERDGSRLQLDWNEDRDAGGRRQGGGGGDDGLAARFDARSEVDPDLLERLAPLL